MICFHFFCALAKLRKATISFFMSVRPHGATRLSLNGFSRNVIYKYFSKICREYSHFITIWQELRVLYMKINTHFWSYRSLNAIVAQLKNCVWEMGKRKCTYKYAWLLIFWKCFDSSEFNCILVIYSCHFYGLLVFNNPLLRT